MYFIDLGSDSLLVFTQRFILYVTTMMDASSMFIVNYSGPRYKNREGVKKSGGKVASPLPAKGKYK